MVNWIIEPFGKGHDRSAFTSGKPPLDDFIRHRVSQYEKRRLGKTFVAVPEGEQRVIGYYTLAAGAITFEHLPTVATRKLPKHPIPVILLARLAVDQSAQGQRLGEGLLLDALGRSLDLSDNLGAYAVEVDAIDDSAVAFYVKFGFTPLLDDPKHLYLPMSTIRKAWESTRARAPQPITDKRAELSLRRFNTSSADSQRKLSAQTCRVV